MGFDDEYYMSLALLQAQKAADMGEVPVGAVAVWEGQVVGVGWQPPGDGQACSGPCGAGGNRRRLPQSGRMALA